MSARQKLLDFITANEPDDGNTMGFAEGVGGLWGEKYKAHAEKLLDAYAHELAERQRDYVRTLARDPFRFGSAHWAVVGADAAAALIDPEVSS